MFVDPATLERATYYAAVAADVLTSRTATYVYAGLVVGLDALGYAIGLESTSFFGRIRQFLQLARRAVGLVRKTNRGVPFMPRSLRRMAAQVDKDNRSTLAGYRAQVGDQAAEILALKATVEELQQRLDASSAPREAMPPSPTQAILSQHAGELAEMRGILRKLYDQAILNGHPVDASNTTAMRDAIAKAEAARQMHDEALREMREAAGLAVEAEPAAKEPAPRAEEATAPADAPADPPKAE